MIEHSIANNKPVLDEDSFTRLLAAAYVMQEHHDRVRTKVSPADLTEILAQVVETQHEIQSGAYRGAAAFALVAKRLSSLTGASGVAIATINSDKLLYRAAIGSASAMGGSEIKKQDSLAAACLKAGTAFQSPLAQTDPRLNSAQCRRLGAQSLLVIPLHHDDNIAGAVELYFSQVSGFGDIEIRAAELMAGVASEVVADDAEQVLREEVESERSSVLQALQILEPELQKIADAETETSVAKPASELCRACGNIFVGNENSCGVCGASRATGMYPGAALQSKWAVLWERHLTGAEQNGMPLFRKTPMLDTPVSAGKMSEQFVNDFDVAERTHEEETEKKDARLGNAAAHNAETSLPPAEIETGETAAITPWKSAADAQHWLTVKRPEASKRNRWISRLRAVEQRPGDACLALASALLLITLIWAFWPRREKTALANATPPSMTTMKRRPRPKPPKLSLLEEALVGLGLAVPPPTPDYMGDPNIKVWEDLQTALYYCPDADLYGTTSKGRYTTQAEAQQDAFEPAFRKPCD